MGKLAERFTDATRSGVYRVRTPDIPRAAAGEAQARLVEVAADALANGGASALRRVLAHEDRVACVVLVSDATTLGARRHEEMVAALSATARACREASRPFFAVLVDPGGLLALPPLYHEKADS